MFSKDVTKHKNFATANVGGLDENKNSNNSNSSININSIIINNNNNIGGSQHYSPSHSSGTMAGERASSTPQRSNNDNQAADEALSPLFQFMAEQQVADRQELGVMSATVRATFGNLADHRAMRRLRLEAVLAGHGIAVNNSSSNNNNIINSSNVSAGVVAATMPSSTFQADGAFGGGDFGLSNVNEALRGLDGVAVSDQPAIVMPTLDASVEYLMNMNDSPLGGILPGDYDSQFGLYDDDFQHAMSSLFDLSDTKALKNDK